MTIQHLEPDAAAVESSRCPIEALLRVADIASAPWLKRAIRDYLQGAALDEALGLSGAPGRPTARTRYLRRRRDHFLHQAWLEIPGELGPFERSEALERECRRVESLWPSLRHRSDPPANFNAVRRGIFHALQTGETLPKLRQLHSICTALH